MNPGEVEHFAYYSQHLGPRFEAAGLRVQFHYNQVPGIVFKTHPPEEYREAILKGLRKGLADRFPDFPSSASVWITEITDGINSSQRAFYKVARLVIEQAYFLRTMSAD